MPTFWDGSDTTAPSCTPSVTAWRHVWPTCATWPRGRPLHSPKTASDPQTANELDRLCVQTGPPRTEPPPTRKECPRCSGKWSWKCNALSRLLLPSLPVLSQLPLSLATGDVSCQVPPGSLHAQRHVGTCELEPFSLATRGGVLEECVDMRGTTFCEVTSSPQRDERCWCAVARRTVSNRSSVLQSLPSKPSLSANSSVRARNSCAHVGGVRRVAWASRGKTSCRPRRSILPKFART